MAVDFAVGDPADVVRAVQIECDIQVVEGAA